EEEALAQGQYEFAQLPDNECTLDADLQPEVSSSSPLEELVEETPLSRKKSKKDKKEKKGAAQPEPEPVFESATPVVEEPSSLVVDTQEPSEVLLEPFVEAVEVG